MKDQRREFAMLLVMAVVFAIACVFLGRWQYHRFQAKYDADHIVAHNYRAAPASLGSLLPTPTSTLTHKTEWRSVRVSGTYDAAQQVVVRNRPFGGAYGYEVLAPFDPAGGGPALLVDRGWIESGQTADAPTEIPAPPSGPVTLVVHLRAGEAAKSGSLPTDQFASIDLPRISAATGVPLLAAYGVLTSESPAGSNPPALLPAPDDGGYWGVNLSYAFQWALFGLAGLAFPFVFVRRRRQLLAQDAALDAAAVPDSAPAAGTGTSTDDRARTPAPQPVPARRKKVRIWDEEDD